MIFHQILFLMWMRQGCIGKSCSQELLSQRKKNRRLASRHPRTDLLRSLEGTHQELVVVMENPRLPEPAEVQRIPKQSCPSRAHWRSHYLVLQHVQGPKITPLHAGAEILFNALFSAFWHYWTKGDVLMA